MIKINLTDKDFNKIKFLNPFQQLRIIRHSYSNYDQLINDSNWDKVAIQFYKKVRVKYPSLANVASKWVHSKLTVNEIR